MGKKEYCADVGDLSGLEESIPSVKTQQDLIPLLAFCWFLSLYRPELPLLPVN